VAATVRVGDSKSRAGKNRVVPLNSRARTVVRVWAEQFRERQPEHFVFPTEHVGASGDNFDAAITNTDPTTNVGSLKTAWTTARKNSGVMVRWHDLRHTCVTRLLEQGQSLPMVASIMGWSASTTVRMAQRYGHISPDARREAMESMNVTVAPRIAAEATDDVLDDENSGPVH
jgi:integrase